MSEQEITEIINSKQKYLILKLHEFLEFKGHDFQQHFREIIQRNLDGIKHAATEYASQLFVEAKRDIIENIDLHNQQK